MMYELITSILSPSPVSLLVYGFLAELKLAKFDLGFCLKLIYFLSYNRR